MKKTILSLVACAITILANLNSTYASNGGIIGFKSGSPTEYSSTPPLSFVLNSITIPIGTTPPEMSNIEYAYDDCAFRSITITYSSMYDWEASIDGGRTWNAGSSSLGVSKIWSQPITQTTTFRRTALTIENDDCAVRRLISNYLVVYVSPSSFYGGSITANNTGICHNSSVTFTNTSSASNGTIPLTYQWEEKIGNGSYSAIANANAATYTTPNLTVTTSYRRKASDANNATAYSNEVTISQLASTVAVAVITNGSVATGYCSIVLNAQTATGNTYQWQLKDGNHVYQNINAATASSYTAIQSGDYKVVVTNNTCGSSTVTSEPISVTLTTTSPGNPADFGNNSWKFFAYNGTNDDLNSNAYRGYYDYAIYAFNNIYEPAEYSRSLSPSSLPASPSYSSPWYGCTVDVDNFTLVAKRTGFTCGSYNLQIRVGQNESYKIYLDGNLIATGNNSSGLSTYTVIAGSPFSLNSSSSLEIRVKHNTGGLRFDFEMVQQNIGLTAGSIQPATQTVNYNTAPAALTSATNGNGSATNNLLTYQWEKAASNSGPWTAITNATTANYAPPALLQTTYFRRAANNGTCEGPKYTNTIAVTVNNVPVISPLAGGNITPSSTSICIGSNVTINNTNPASGGHVSLTYSWEQKVGTGSFTTIANATSADFAVTNLSAITTFRRKVTDAINSVAYSNEVTISILAPTLAVALITNGSTATGSCSVVLNAQTETGYTYQWQLKDENNVYQNINAATASTYTAIQSGDYKVVVTTNSCGSSTVASEPISVTLTTTPPGNPADFGNNIWRFFAYNGTNDNLNMNVYRGYYDYAIYAFNNIYEPAEYSRSLSPSSLPASPAFSSPWHGCPVDVDNFTLVAKRTGFTCGSYNLQIRVGVNEFYKIYLDENLIASGINTTNTIYTVIPGSPYTLNSNSKIEIRVTHSTGLLRFDFEMVQQNIGLTAGSIQPATQTVNYNTAPAALTSATNGNGSATNNALTYQWEKAASNSGPWTAITNATTASYAPPALLQTTYFRRAALNGTCEGPKYTNTISVTVTNIPATTPLNAGSITTSSTSICNAGNATISNTAAASGGNATLTYSWEQKVGTGSFTTIANATNADFAVTNLSATTTFRRKVTDAANAVAYSNEITISIFLGGSIAPATQTVNTGVSPLPITSADLASGNSNPVTYQWQSSDAANGTWADITNETNTSYQPSALAQTTYFRRLAFTSTCVAGKASNVSEVIVIQTLALEAGTISNTNNLCVPATSVPPILNASAASGGVAPYTYQWEKDNYGFWIDIAGASNQNYQSGLINASSSFRRKVTDNSGSIAFSNTVTINVQTTVPLKAGIIDGAQVTCEGTAPGIINNIIDACGGGGILQYTWESFSNGAWSVIANSNEPTHNATAISSNTKYRRKIGDGCGNAAYSNEVEVIVYPTIDAGLIYPTSQSVCSGFQPSLLSQMQDCHYTNGNVTYSWQIATSASGPWTDIRGRIGQQSVYQPSGTNVTTYYRLKVMSTICGAFSYSNLATINVNNNCLPSELGKAANQLPSSNLSTKGNMKVYPNPATHGQNVFVTVDGGEGTYKAILRSTDGRAYNCTVSSSAKGQLQVKLPQPMANGTYLIQVSNNQKQWIERIVVQ